MKLEDIVLEELSNFNCDVEDYTMSTRFCNTGIDDLDIIETIFNIEKRMDCVINDRVFEINLLECNIGDFVNSIKNNIE